jgi:hypothetical protein
MTKNIIGWSGAFIFLIAYFLNSFKIVGVDDLSFHIMNLIGAILLGYRVWLDNNYSNLLLECCFFCIAIFHIIRIVLC